MYINDDVYTLLNIAKIVLRIQDFNIKQRFDL